VTDQVSYPYKNRQSYVRIYNLLGPTGYEEL
jgi:hypothetical protein